MTEQPDPSAPPSPGGGRRAAAVLRSGAARAGRVSRVMGRWAAKGARLAGRGGRAGARRVRTYTHSAGAGESGLARLVELHFVTGCGDAALTVSLAGTIFAMPTSEARGQVAQFLLLTMAPFSVLAPFVGPLLDRFRSGRRWAIGTTLAVRAFLCWVLAGAVTDGSPWLFPAALGCLVASKAYGVSRSSSVPRVLPPGFSLVKANSRQALAGVAGLALGGGVAAAVSRIGPQWSLRLAFVLYVVGTILAIRLPQRVDSNVGEQDIEDTIPIGELPTRPPRAGRGSPVARLRARVAALPVTVQASISCAIGARLLTGFLTLFMAFLMRAHPIPGHSGTFVLALVIGAAGVGNATATLLGSALGRRRPDLIVSAILITDVVTAVSTALFYSLGTLLTLGLVAGLSAQLVNLCNDAIIQRDIPEAVRTRVFAWSETVLQISWVVGGAIGISLPLVPQLGFGVIATLLVLVLLGSVRVRMVGRAAARASGARPSADGLSSGR